MQERDEQQPAWPFEGKELPPEIDMSPVDQIPCPCEESVPLVDSARQIIQAHERQGDHRKDHRIIFYS